MSDALVVRAADTTLADTPPTPRPPALPSRTADSDALRNPDDVLRSNEIRRSRLWVTLCAVLALCGVIAAAAVAAPPVTRAVFALGSAMQLIAALIALRVLRDDRQYTRELGELYSYLSVACMLPAYYFCGWASAVVLVMPLGGVLFGLHQERAATIRMAVVTCGSYAAIALAAIFGAIDDRSVFAFTGDPRVDQVLFLGFAEIVMAASFVMGGQLRGHFLDAIDRYGRAVHDGARRDALLQEALLDLAFARRSGQAGRFTGMELGGFRLGAVIGRGGMGEVYEAERPAGGGPVAIKVVTAAGAQSEHALARFDREIRIAASLESPHVARVIGYSSPHEPLKYLAMERLVGASLAELLREGPMPVRDALGMLEQVAAAIDLAHAAGIVHRDLKPSNLFRHDDDAAPLWKVLDFGVSKLADSEGTLTAGGIVGTPAYMAPEQASGGVVGPAADRFALGAIAYRVLVGRPAFGGRVPAAALYAVVHSMPPRPSVVAAVPRDLDRVLAIALAKSPRDRFGSARELVAALADACRADLSVPMRRRGESMIAAHPWR